MVVRAQCSKSRRGCGRQNWSLGRQSGTEGWRYRLLLWRRRESRYEEQGLHSYGRRASSFLWRLERITRFQGGKSRRMVRYWRCLMGIAWYNVVLPLNVTHTPYCMLEEYSRDEKSMRRSSGVLMLSILWDSSVAKNAALGAVSTSDALCAFHTTQGRPRFDMPLGRLAHTDCGENSGFSS